MRISVIVTSFNQKKYLIEAIESVLSQTFQPYEIIIADNHSSDGSVDVIRGYAKRYPGQIVTLFRDRNIGISANKNKALEQVQGDYVTILDGDDRFLPQKLELERETCMSNPEAGIVHSNWYYIDEQGRRIGVWSDRAMSPPTGYVFREVFARDYLNGSDIFRNELVAVSSLREVGLYDEELPIYEDWDLRIRLTKRFKTAYCREPLVEYRIHPGGVSKSPATLHLWAMRRVYGKNIHLLSDLEDSDRAAVERRIRSICALLAKRAAMEAMDNGRRGEAFQFWFESLQYDSRRIGPILLARIALPRKAYSGLRSAYDSLR